MTRKHGMPSAENLSPRKRNKKENQQSGLSDNKSRESGDGRADDSASKASVASVENNQLQFFGKFADANRGSNKFESTCSRFDKTHVQLKAMFEEAERLTKEDFINEIEPLLKKLGYFPNSLIEDCKNYFSRGEGYVGFRVAYKITRALTEMRMQVRETQNVLSTLAGVAQEETKGSMTETITEENSQKTAPQLNSAELAFIEYYEPNRPVVGGLPVLKDGNKESLKGTEFEGERIWTVDMFNDLTATSLGAEDLQRLKNISNQFGQWLARGTIVSREEGKKIRKEKLSRGVSQMSASLRGKVQDDDDERYCPPMISFELQGSQPAFESLLNEVITSGHPDSKPFSPCKKSEPNKRIPAMILSKEQNQSKGTRIKRFVDLVAKKPGRLELVMLDSTMKLTIEVKPLFRSSENPDQLRDQCFNQIIGHLTKYINQCFNFRGVGVSSFGTSIIATLAYIQVIQVYLIVKNADEKGDGMTEMFKMESKYLPLITLENFEAWEKNHDEKWRNDNAGHLEKLKKKIYGEDLKGGCSEGIPKGILALREIMGRPRGCFFGRDFDARYKEVDGESDLRLNGVFGQGAQGVVLGAEKRMEKGTNYYAVKAAPTTSSEKYINHECNVLKHLGQSRESSSSSPKDFISILEREVNLNVELGSLKEKVPALSLSPRGMPLLHYLQLRSSNDERYAVSKAVWEQGGNALGYVHSKGIVHNDVTPKNIIVVSAPPEPLKLCLIDFGTACGIGYKLPFFCGTMPYAHDYLLRQYPDGYEAMIECDEYGLALTSLATRDGGRSCWDMIDFEADRTGVLKSRKTTLDGLLAKIEETEFRAQLEITVGWKKEEVDVV